MSELGDAPTRRRRRAAPASPTHLREAILRGELAPGDRIRQEEVAERLGASRLPVREALRMLEAEGLTEHEAAQGRPGAAAVACTRSTSSTGCASGSSRWRSPRACRSSTADDRARLEEVQERIEANDGPRPKFLDLDREFHLLTYTGCHIDPLMRKVTRLWNSTQHYRRAFVALGGPGRMWVVNAEHRLILDAVVRRDADDAERFLGGHIRRTRIELGHHPEVFGP